MNRLRHALKAALALTVLLVSVTAAPAPAHADLTSIYAPFVERQQHWTDWTPYGGIFTSKPAIVPGFYNPLIIGRGGNNSYWCHNCPGAWTSGSWASIGGDGWQFAYGPGATKVGDVAYVAGVGTDHRVFLNTLNTGDGNQQWTGWALQDPAMQVYSAVQPMYFIGLGSPRLLLLARGGDGAMWCYNCPALGDGAWRSLGGSFNSGPTAQVSVWDVNMRPLGPYSLAVSALDAGNVLQFNQYNPDTAQWSGWSRSTQAPRPWASDPAALSMLYPTPGEDYGDMRFDTSLPWFELGNDGNVWCGGWCPWLPYDGAEPGRWTWILRSPSDQPPRYGVAAEWWKNQDSSVYRLTVATIGADRQLWIRTWSVNTGI